MCVQDLKFVSFNWFMSSFFWCFSPKTIWHRSSTCNCQCKFCLVIPRRWRSRWGWRNKIYIGRTKGISYTIFIGSEIRDQLTFIYSSSPFIVFSEDRRPKDMLQNIIFQERLYSLMVPNFKFLKIDFTTQTTLLLDGYTLIYFHISYGSC